MRAIPPLLALVLPCSGQRKSPDAIKSSLLTDETLSFNHPGYANGTATMVTAGVRIAHLYGIDSRTKTYKISGTLQMQWTDPRLQFSEEEMGDFDHLQWPDGAIWTPKLYFEDAVDVGPDPFVYTSSWASGLVRKESQFTMQLLCTDMNFELYPWDSQSCTMRLLPLTESAARVKLDIMNPGMTIDGGFDALKLGEWESFNASWSPGTTELSFFSEPTSWSHIDYTLEMQRRTGGTFSRLLVPFYLITVMSYSGYWINPSAAPGRIALAIICVLATLSHRGAVLARIPQVAYHVWIDQFLMVNLFFNFFAMVSYAAVNFGLAKHSQEAKEDEERRKAQEAARSLEASAPTAVEKKASLSSAEPGRDGGDFDADLEHHEHHRKIVFIARSFRRAAQNPSLGLLVYADHVMRVLFPLLYIIANLILWLRVI